MGVMRTEGTETRDNTLTKIFPFSTKEWYVVLMSVKLFNVPHLTLNRNQSG